MDDILKWSPCRFCLKFKGLPYETVWVEYPDIEATCKKIGASPTSKRSDGSPIYTVPVIHDSCTGAVIADSVLIAEYLDVTYPDTPKLLPSGTKALQSAFIVAHWGTITGLFEFIRPAALRILNPPREEYYRRTKFASNAKLRAPEGNERVEKWAKAKEGFGLLASWLEKSEGPFVMGDTVTFVDFVIGGCLFWMRSVFGEDSTEWADIKGWHGGRWDALLKNLEKYL